MAHMSMTSVTVASRKCDVEINTVGAGVRYIRTSILA